MRCFIRGGFVALLLAGLFLGRAWAVIYLPNGAPTADAQCAIYGNGPWSNDSVTIPKGATAYFQAINEADVDVPCDGGSAVDDEVTTFQWDFSYDGQNFNVEGTGKSASHPYSSPGHYTVALRIDDAALYANDSSVIADTVQVHVFQLSLTHLEFDWSESNTANALSIRHNYATPYTLPEWVKGGRNDPAAYVVSMSVRVVGRFTIEPSDISSARVQATSSDTLGDLEPETITFSGGVSSPEYQGFDAENTTPGAIKRFDQEWEWYAASPPDGTNWVKFDDSGPHKVYVVLDVPQNPWYCGDWTTHPYNYNQRPWRTALDKLCNWAVPNLSDPSEAVSAVAQGLYGCIGRYNSIDGDPQYTDWSDGTLDLTSLIANLGGNEAINCYDCGKGTVAIANVGGCDGEYKRVYPFGYVNCVKAAGHTVWANNPFWENDLSASDKIVGKDDDWEEDRRSYFWDHAFATRTYIYDASAKVDWDDKPYEPPHQEAWLVHLSWTTFKSKLWDDTPEGPDGAPGTPTKYTFDLQ